MKITDKQLESAAGYITCNRSMYSNPTAQVCKARSTIIGGKVASTHTCGLVCDFQRELLNYRDKVELLRHHDELLQRARALND